MTFIFSSKAKIPLNYEHIEDFSLRDIINNPLNKNDDILSLILKNKNDDILSFTFNSSIYSTSTISERLKLSQKILNFISLDTIKLNFSEIFAYASFETIKWIYNIFPVDVNEHNNETNQTPLMAAVFRDDQDSALIVDFLIKNGAKTSFSYNKQNLLIRTLNVDVVKTLISFGADPLQKESNGETAFSYWISLGFLNFAKIAFENNPELFYQKIFSNRLNSLQYPLIIYADYTIKAKNISKHAILEDIEYFYNNCPEIFFVDNNFEFLIKIFEGSPSGSFLEKKALSKLINNKIQIKHKNKNHI